MNRHYLLVLIALPWVSHPTQAQLFPGSRGFGPPQALAVPLADGATAVYATDLDGDGDGDQDVLSASYHDNKIAWYANDGRGNFGPQQVITTQADGATAVYATDLDGDGDQDVLSASEGDDKIAWYANNGQGSFGPQQVITTQAVSARSVYAADLDSDGDQDVLSASAWDDKIAWYENQLDTVAPVISSLALVDADTDQRIQPLADGQVIDLSSLELTTFSVQAIGEAAPPSAVYFALSGPVSQTRTDREAPFTLFNTQGSDYLGRRLLEGNYTLTATPIQQGLSGPTVTISFRVIPRLIESFTLVSADNNQDIRQLIDGSVVDPAILADLGFNIRANADVAVVQIDFELDGPVSSRESEEQLPFAVLGDADGDYYRGEPLPGDYTLRATPFTESVAGSLVAGRERTIQFSFASSSALRVYPNHFSNELFIKGEKAELHQVQLMSVQGGASYVIPVGDISREEEGLRLKTQHIPSGQYILRVIGANWIETRHVIKQ